MRRFVEQQRPIQRHWCRRQSPASAFIVAHACLDELAAPRFPLNGSDDENFAQRVQLDIVRIVGRRVCIVASHQVNANIPLLVATHEHECSIIFATEVRTQPGPASAEVQRVTPDQRAFNCAYFSGARDRSVALPSRFVSQALPPQPLSLLPRTRAVRRGMRYFFHDRARPPNSEQLRGSGRARSTRRRCHDIRGANLGGGAAAKDLVR